MFDMLVYYLYDSRYPFCVVSRGTGKDVFVLEFAPVAFGHAASSLIAVICRGCVVHVYCHGYRG